jgi:hypothetical protein
MPIDQFADVSKDLCLQIKVIENLLKSNEFSEANALVANARKSCHTQESLMVDTNKIQIRIVENRQKEIIWIQDAIQINLKKSSPQPSKKRKPKSN